MKLKDVQGGISSVNSELRSTYPTRLEDRRQQTLFVKHDNNYV